MEKQLARELLNRRYDDLETGKVTPIPGDEVAAFFREKSAAAPPRATGLMTVYDFQREATVRFVPHWEGGIYFGLSSWLEKRKDSGWLIIRQWT